MALKLVCPSCEQTFTPETPPVNEETTCPLCRRRFNIYLEGNVALSAAPSTAYSPSIKRIRFTFSCSRCSSVLEATDDLCGRPGRCPTCGGVFRVPPIDPQTGLAAGRALVENDGQLPTPMHAYATAGARAPKIVTRPDGQQVIVCPRCGRADSVDANLCGSCGMPFTMEGAEVIIQTGGGPEANTLASAALTVGVLSIPTFCVPVLGVVAVVLGFLAIRRAESYGPGAPGRRMALVGIICGLMSVALCAVRYSI